MNPDSQICSDGPLRPNLLLRRGDRPGWDGAAVSFWQGPGAGGGCFRQRDFLVWAVALRYSTRGKITWGALNEVSWAGWSDRRCGTLVKYPKARFYFFLDPPAFSSSTETSRTAKLPLCPREVASPPSLLPHHQPRHMLSNMDPFTTLVPGSRRPFNFLSTQLPPPPIRVTQSHPQDSSMRPQVTPPSTSTRRRKPTITYRSPSVEFAPYSLNDPNISAPVQSESVDNPNTSPYSSAHGDSSSSASSPSPRTPSSSSLASLLTDASSASSFAKPLSTREVYAMAPPLPLYHPLGALALRLPLLGESPKTPHTQLIDPTPSKPIQPIASNRPRNNTSANRSRNSGRSRKTTSAKSRDVLVDTDPLIPDEKDKDQDEYVASHRSRRNGPSVSLSASAQAELIAAEGRKRKRREADTGDPSASPPIPKRSRQPRTGTSTSTPNNPVSPTPSFIQLKDEIETPDAMEVEEDEEPPFSARTNGRRRNAKTAGRRNNTRRAGLKKEKERSPSSDEVSYDQPSVADQPQAQEASGELAKDAEEDGDSPTGDEAIVSSRSPPIVAPVPTHLIKNPLEGLNMSTVNAGDRVDSAGPAYI